MAKPSCASRIYLAKNGVPETIEALCHHRALNFLSTRTGKPFAFDFIAGGTPRSVTMKRSVSVTNADAYHACCAAHLGLVQAPRYHLETLLGQGSLVEVLAPFRPAPMPVSVLYKHSRQLSPRVRVFVDWLADVMAKAG